MKLRRGRNMKIVAPTRCPSCDAELERVKDQLFCRNSQDCPAQSTKKLQNFCKKLKIKGFGEQTLSKLELVHINDLLELTPEYASSKGLSDRMATKLANTVADRLAQGFSPNDFLAACSIPMIGDGAMRKLKFESVDKITYELCRSFGIGDKASQSLITWISDNWNNYKGWEAYFETPTIVESAAKESTGIVVCITGKLNDYSNRKEAAAYLESIGVEVKSSVTTAVTHLICEDGTRGSSFKKAESYGIQITTIKDILEDIQ